MNTFGNHQKIALQTYYHLKIILKPFILAIQIHLDIHGLAMIHIED